MASIIVSRRDNEYLPRKIRGRIFRSGLERKLCSSYFFFFFPLFLFRFVGYYRSVGALKSRLIFRASENLRMELGIQFLRCYSLFRDLSALNGIKLISSIDVSIYRREESFERYDLLVVKFIKIHEWKREIVSISFERIFLILSVLNC